MKLKSRIVFIGLIWTFLLGCNDVPEFGIIPSIELKSISFLDKTGDYDSLVIEIEFRDGDGDLGLDDSYDSNPYHPVNFIVVNGQTVTEVPTFNGYTQPPNPVRFYENVLEPETNLNGILATSATHDDPDYQDIVPANEFPYTCTSYTATKVWLYDNDDRFIDETYNVVNVDTLVGNGGPIYLKQVEAVFYTKPNVNSTNITADIYYKDGGEFKLFNWLKDVAPPDCGFPPNARFPIITETQEPTEGVIRYYIGSSGFKSLFGTKELQLKIQIRDRALHSSNIIESGVFTLNQIKK